MDLPTKLEEQSRAQDPSSSNSTSDTEKPKEVPKEEKSKKMTFNDFKTLRILGTGAYGKVVLANNIHTKKNYAIKIIDKTFIEREDKVEQVHIERLILSLFDHPNIIKLFSTFQNKKKLYFVLELAERGDLKEFITTHNVLPYDLAKYYAAEIVNALEYIHSKGFVHRDIKPENIIINSKYHLKIIDFATASCLGKYFDMKEKKFKDEIGNEEIKSALIGTAEYISPEMIRDGKCGIAGDLWALGCIIYQFFHGVTPFYDITDHKIMNNIITGRMSQISNTVTLEAKDIILKLLVFEPEKRLGAGAKGSDYCYKALKKHKFFEGIDFDTLSKTDPPYKANVVQSPNPGIAICSNDLKTVNYKDFLIEEESEPMVSKFVLKMNYFGGDEQKEEAIIITQDKEQKSSKEETKQLKSDSIDMDVSPLGKNICQSSLFSTLSPSSVYSYQKQESNKEGIIYEGMKTFKLEVVKKKSPWFHYNTRRLILYSDKIEYYDPTKNLKKGEIMLNKNCTALIKDEFRFELFTPKRTYLFKLDNVGSKEWTSKINCVIEELKK